MKKLSFWVMMFMVMIVPVMMVSCGDDDEPVGGSTGPGGEPPMTQIDVNAQKQIISNTAEELIGKFNAADFRQVVDLFEYVDKNSQNGDEIGAWFEQCVQMCMVSFSDSLVENVYKLSNFYGQFELRNGLWTKTSSKVNFLEFNFTDDEGQPCSLRLTCSGKDTPVHHDSFDDTYRMYYEDNGEYYYLMTRIKNTFVIPENINITLTRRGNSVAAAQMTSNISLRGGDDEFDYKRDGIELSAEVSVGNYKWTVDKVAFNAGRSASFSESLSKDGQKLVSLSMTASGDVTDETNLSGGLTSLNFDILGKVAIKGNINDITKFSVIMEDVDDICTDEMMFKEKLQSANNLLDLKLYLNGSNSACAYLQLYPFVDEDSYYGQIWYYQPVIMFSDGTSYSTFASYFDETTYQGVIKKFYDMAYEFMALVDKNANIAW